MRSYVSVSGALIALLMAIGVSAGPRQAAAADQPSASVTGQAAVPWREIFDPNSGDRWLLMRDALHPEGPGRLVRVGRMLNESGDRGQPLIAVALPVIHAGDRVRLEEHTLVVNAVFESVALGAAPAGGPVKVRLKIGGRVVQAVATAPGHAAIVTESEVQR